MVKNDNFLTFPLLSIRDIIGCMEDLEIPLSEQELRQPTSQRLLSVCLLLKEHLTGTTNEPSSYACLDLLDHPQLYQESLHLMVIYRQLLKFFNDIGVENFTLQDILHPTTGRVCAILSAIINFFKFREQRIHVFEQCTSKSDVLVEDKQRLTKEIAEVAEKVNTIRLQRAEQEPMVQAEKQKMKIISKDLLELKDRQTNITEKIESLKTTKSTLADKLGQNEFLLTNLTHDTSRLESQIVSNPEKLKQAIRDMNESLKSDKQMSAKAERKARGLQNKIEIMNEVEQDIVVCIKSLNEALLARQTKQTTSNKLSAEKDALERKKGELSELTVNEQSSKEKLVRLEKHLSTKQLQSETNIKKLQEEFVAVEQDRLEKMEIVKETNVKIAELEQKLSDFNREYDLEMTNLEKRYSELGVALSNYQGTILQAIQKT